MTIQILSRRSSLLNDRPFPIRLGEGELALNINPNDPGLFFADSTAAPSTGLIKIGPVHVSATPPNASPTGFVSLSKGEQWLNTTASPVLNIYDGSTWQQPKAIASIASSGFPASPINGQLHYNKAALNFYIYDGSISSWTSLIGTSTPGTTPVTLDLSVVDIFGLNDQELFANDPNVDSLVFWDDSAGKLTHLTLGANLSITGTTLNASGGSGVSDGDKGDIIVSGGGATWTIDNNVVTYAKIQDVSTTDKLLGRSTAGAGAIEEIICTAAGRALLDDINAAAQRTTLGLATVANTGAYSDLSGTPTLPVAADETPQALGVAAVGSSTDYAREDHVHVMPSAGDVGADATGTAATAISTHEAAADPHPGYALESSLATVATSGNYSDLSNTPTLGNAAGLDVGTTAGTVAAGNDARFVVEDIYVIACSDETTDLTTGTAKVTFRMPAAGTLTGVKATVTTAPVGSNLIVDINEAGTSVLSTKLSIDDGEKTSETAATPPVISDSALADDAEITIDIDQVGSSTAGAGLKVTLYITRN